MSPRYSVIIPAHNEENRIEATLRDYASVFDDSEILVVLNGCSDKTEDRVRSVRREYANIQYIEIPHPVGKGGAVRAGFLLAQAPLVGFVDADGATPATEMLRLFSLIGNSDAVIGSRWMRGSTVEVSQPFQRRVASRVFNTCVRVLFGLPFHDTQCGAKVFKAKALEAVIERVETANMAFDVDVSFALKEAGYKITEAPTVWRDVEGTRVRLVSASAKMFASLLRLRMRESFLRYALPFFDRLFPTKPIRVHDGFSILILNLRDPTHPQAGGAETYLFEMAKRWVTLGNDVEWLTASYKGAERNAMLDGVRITRVGNAVTVYGAVPLEYLRNFRDRFDVIVDSENGIPFFSPLFSLKTKICVMHHVHQRVFRAHLPFPVSEIFAWIERKVMPLVYSGSQFVAVSDDTRSEMEQLRISKTPIEVVRNGVDPRLLPGEKATAPTVLYLGRLKAYKRVDLLIRAFARVLASVPDAVLMIAGAGDAKEQLVQLVNELGLHSKVSFEGYVDDRRKRELLQQAWVYVSASEMEGWGISVTEANACGTPAVAFAVPGLREAIIANVNGLLVPDGQDLSRAITSLLSDHELRERLERGALERARTLSWDRSAEDLLEIIMRCVAGTSYSLVRLKDHWTVVSGGYSPAGPFLVPKDASPGNDPSSDANGEAASTYAV